MPEALSNIDSGSPANTASLGFLDLPLPPSFHDWSALSFQLSEYLNSFLTHYHWLHPAVKNLNIPSVMDLAGFFHCCESDVLVALRALRYPSFRYEVHGIDKPILLELSNIGEK